MVTCRSGNVSWPAFASEVLAEASYICRDLKVGQIAFNVKINVLSFSQVLA